MCSSALWTSSLARVWKHGIKAQQFDRDLRALGSELHLGLIADDVFERPGGLANLPDAKTDLFHEDGVRLPVIPETIRGGGTDRGQAPPITVNLAWASMRGRCSSRKKEGVQARK